MRNADACGLLGNEHGFWARLMVNITRRGKNVCGGRQVDYNLKKKRKGLDGWKKMKTTCQTLPPRNGVQVFTSSFVA